MSDEKEKSGGSKPIPQSDKLHERLGDKSKERSNNLEKGDRQYSRPTMETPIPPPPPKKKD